MADQLLHWGEGRGHEQEKEQRPQEEGEEAGQERDVTGGGSFAENFNLLLTYKNPILWCISFLEHFVRIVSQQ